MNILVKTTDEIPITEGLIKSKDIICPQCKHNCLLDIEDYKIKLYDCKNSHETNNILLNEFDNKQKINENEIICKNCDQTKYKAYNRLFYRCLECNINLCPLCKEKHSKDLDHEIIDYNNIKYICEDHCDFYISYCKECKINLCMNCENKHNNKHHIISFKSILPEDNIKEELQEFRKKIDKLNANITEIKGILNKVYENMEIYYKIVYDIVNNYNKKQKNYEIMKNISLVKDFIKVSDLNDIIDNNNNNDYIKKFDALINMYNKMNNIEIITNKKNINKKDDNKEKRESEKEELEIKIENIKSIKTEYLSSKAEKRIIKCKTLKKTVLNDKKLVIKIGEPKQTIPFFGPKYLLYKIETETFGWIVYRKYNDFEDLRKIITYSFPEFCIPFLKNKNSDENIEKELIDEKQSKYLNLFMNTLVQNESFKTSEALLTFLSCEDKNKFENVMKAYLKRQPKSDSKIEEYETIDGNATIGNFEENKKYSKNVKKYFELQGQILDKINFSFKDYLGNMLKVEENLKEIKKWFDVMKVLNERVKMNEAIKKAYEELSLFFEKYQKILKRRYEIFKLHFKDYFKNINLEGEAFKELIERREKLNEKYIMDKSELNYNKLGYAEKTLFRELKKMIKDYCVRNVDNIKNFNQKYYPTINDEVGIWSNLEAYVMAMAKEIK